MKIPDVQAQSPFRELALARQAQATPNECFACHHANRPPDPSRSRHAPPPSGSSAVRLAGDRRRHLGDRLRHQLQDQALQFHRLLYCGPKPVLVLPTPNITLLARSVPICVAHDISWCYRQRRSLLTESIFVHMLRASREVHMFGNSLKCGVSNAGHRTYCRT